MLRLARVFGGASAIDATSTSEPSVALAPSTEKLPGVQVLRAVAALLVVVLHAEFWALHGLGLNHKPLLLVGSAGVDIFFVISGFIMLVSSKHLFGSPGGRATFITRRLIRIVPLYWAVTTLRVLELSRQSPSPVSIETVIASYLFWPFIGLDGTSLPVLGVGWTLNLEMFFYALFALAIGARRDIAVVCVTVALLIAVAIAPVLGEFFPPLAFWGQPIVLEFAAGIGLGVAYERGWRIPAPLALLIILVAVIALTAQIGTDMGGPRLICAGLPSLLLVGGVVLAKTKSHGLRPPRSLVFLGDASYSLYLVHPMVTAMIGILMTRFGLISKTAIGAGTIILAGTIVSIIAAIATFLLFERPVTRLLRSRFERRFEHRLSDEKGTNVPHHDHHTATPEIVPGEPPPDPPQAGPQIKIVGSTAA